MRLCGRSCRLSGVSTAATAHPTITSRLPGPSSVSVQCEARSNERAHAGPVGVAVASILREFTDEIIAWHGAECAFGFPLRRLGAHTGCLKQSGLGPAEDIINNRQDELTALGPD